MVSALTKGPELNAWALLNKNSSIFPSERFDSAEFESASGEGDGKVTETLRASAHARAEALHKQLLN